MIVDIGGLGQKDLATGVGSLIKGVFIIVGSGSNEDGIATFFLTAFATTFVTSAWLWLALICTPIVRFFVWSRRTGLTTFGRIFDAERKPFTALGYVTALLILIIGGSIWGVTKAMAAFG